VLPRRGERRLGFILVYGGAVAAAVAAADAVGVRVRGAAR
jgi:hypothetical protein